jgi:predicted dehydrogenase
MSLTISRRNFISTAATASSILVLPRHVLGIGGTPGANSKINVAGVGIGGMGGGNLRNIKNLGDPVIALCDVDTDYSKRTRQNFPQAKFYQDYREMLAQEKDIDAVLVGTPDHTHAVIAAAAMKAGKHVFVQKPLCHDIYECRELTRIAKDKGVVTQMGIQGRASLGLHLIRKWVDANAIGEITAIDAWCDLSYYPWGHAGWSTSWGRKPAEKQPIPRSLNWDLWLGPAPERAYHRAYHPATWRAWWDFGNGMMGDRGAHTLDSVFTVLGERMPVEIDATSCGLNPDTHPLSAVITFRLAAGGGKPPMKVTWYEGTRPPRPEGLPDNQQLHREGGIIFTGTKGKIIAGVYGDNPRLLPVERQKEFPVKRPPAGVLPRGGIEGDWLDSIRAGRKACADFAYSARLTEFTMLGNIAKRVDGRILWDEAAMRVTNNEAANNYIKSPRRSGWEL